MNKGFAVQFYQGVVLYIDDTNYGDTFYIHFMNTEYN